MTAPREHNMGPQGPDRAQECQHPGCSLRVRFPINGRLEWQSEKGGRWHRILDRDLPPCTGKEEKEEEPNAWVPTRGGPFSAPQASQERESWPTAEYATRTVTDLVTILEPFAAGEEGHKDVVGRVKRLLAELARLKPSGQVAEDVARTLMHLLEDTVEHEDTPDSLLERWVHAEPLLRALTAKAQGYEAAVADNAEMLDGIQRMRNLLLYPHDEWHQVAADAIRVGNDLVKENHPGAALLERHQGLEKRFALVSEMLASIADHTKEPQVRQRAREALRKAKVIP